MEYEIAELKPLVSEAIKRTGRFPNADDWQEIKVELWSKQIAFLADAAVMRTQEMKQEYYPDGHLKQRYPVEYKQEYKQKPPDTIMYSSTGLAGGGSFTTLGESADFASALKAGGTSALVSSKGVTNRTLNHPGI